MDVKVVVQRLKDFAPLFLAGSWDNVGLLVLPPSLSKVTKMLLTNDLTEAVMDEVERKKVDFILSYHPPIFKPLKTITTSHWKERIIGRCLEKQIAIYSPHTSYDAVKGGVNDWLIEAFGEGEVTPIEPSSKKSHWSYSITFCVTSAESLPTILKQLEQNFKETSVNSKDINSVSVLCTKGTFASLLSMIESSPHIIQSTVAISLLAEKVPVTDCGMGRQSKLSTPIKVAEAVHKVKEHLQLPHIRLALKHSGQLDSLVRTVAVCAGSGASVLRGVKADLFLTGEMSHHDVLEAVHAGTHVILTDHSNSERGFLRTLQPELRKLIPDLEIIVSEVDADPLTIV